VQEFVEWTVYNLEWIAEFLETESRKHNRVLRNTLVADVSGLSTDQMAILKHFKETVMVAQSYYAESGGRIRIVEAPWAFTLIWAIVKPFFNEKTLEKIQIVGAGETSPTLLKLVDKDKLPTFLGGTCECKGGCVPKMDRFEGLTKIEVAARGKELIKIPITDVPAFVTWDILTKDYDISYELQFVGELSSVELSKPKRVDCHVHPITETAEITEAGTLTLTLDNTYSTLRGKTVYYKVVQLPTAAAKKAAEESTKAGVAGDKS